MTYHDQHGHFISKGEFELRLQRSRHARQQYRAGGKFAKKANYSWVWWVALGAFSVAILAIFI